MEYNFVNILKLLIAVFLPVILSIILYLIEKKTKLIKIKYIYRQILIGILFGAVTIIATEIGIPVEGAIINIIDASPLTAGLLFGGPAGIIAGIIGGLYRFISIFWGKVAFSQLSSTITSIFAGFFAAGCRKFMFDNKKPSWFYGLVVGGSTEVLHMVLIFITNMNDIYNAYQVVSICALPMILGNSISVMLSLFLISLIGKERVIYKGKRQISQIFQFILMISVTAAFCITTIFTFVLQTKLAYAEAEKLLELNLEDVEKEVLEVSDSNLLKKAKKIAQNVSINSTDDDLRKLLNDYDISEINIIDENGIIIANASTDLNVSFVGYDMAYGTQSAEFLRLNDGVTTEYVQSYQPISWNKSISRKYAGVAFEDGGFVQVGYDLEQFQNEVSNQIKVTVKNRHVGKKGNIIVCNASGQIVFDNSGHVGDSIFSEDGTYDWVNPGVGFKAVIGNNDYYCMFKITEGFYLIGGIPTSEVMFSRNIAVSMLAYMEIIVFAALFIHIYFLLKRLIVDNIHKINNSLGQISAGNLNIYVNVRENEEFASLSDDINATVDTLKNYISEAENRFDKELEFARQIQHSSLPSVFPPYPERKDFDIYASMAAAKEVGGDFYDFYFVDKDHLVFIVADVSGKGIPGALFMMKAKTLIKNLAESGLNIDDVFTEANHKLCENNDAEMFVTAWMGVLDLKTGLLQYVNAGHNPPLIARNGKYEYLHCKPNFILAGMDDTIYKMEEIQLKPTDKIYLYTDGVSEANNLDNQLYGEERLQNILNLNNLNDAKEICDLVKEDVEKFTSGAEQSDDITMLCVCLNYLKTRHYIAVKPTPDSLEMVASYIAERLNYFGIGDDVSSKAQIATDEIYSNFVNYSSSSVASVYIGKKENKLELIFTNDGDPFDPTKAKEPDTTLSLDERQIGGLGIYIVKKTASSFEYKYEDGKNIITITYDI